MAQQHSIPTDSLSSYMAKLAIAWVVSIDLNQKSKSLIQVSLWTAIFCLVKAEKYNSLYCSFSFEIPPFLQILTRKTELDSDCELLIDACGECSPEFRVAGQMKNNR